MRPAQRSPVQEPAERIPDDPGIVESIQRSDLKRWSPRRAGWPAVADWWPAYVAVAAAALLVLLASARAILEALVPIAHVIVIFSFAAALTFAVSPLVTRLETRMPRPAAVAIVFVVLLVALAGFAIAVAQPLANEGEGLATRITEYSEAVQGKRPLLIGDRPLPPSIQNRIRELAESQGPDLAARSSGSLFAFLAALVDMIIVLVVTFYLLLDARRFRLVALRSLHPRSRPAARRVMDEIARVFGAFLRSQLIVALSLALAVFIALTLIGVPYALFLASFAGLAELIPMLGPIIGAIPALLVALTMPFPAVAWTLLAFVVIQQIESNVLGPRLSGHAVGLHPVFALLALVAGFELGGIVGALFAVPIVGLFWVLVSTAVLAWRGRRYDLERTRLRRPRRRPFTRGNRPVMSVPMDRLSWSRPTEHAAAVANTQTGAPKPGEAGAGEGGS